MVAERDGFALLDVLLGLIVLSLLMLIALPFVSVGTSPSRIEALVTEVAALVKSDRAAAAQAGRTVETLVDVRRRRVLSGVRARNVDLPADLALEVTTSENCARQRDSIVIAFEPDGRSCGAVIRIAKGDISWRIRVNWLTGFVDVVGPT